MDTAVITGVGFSPLVNTASNDIQNFDDIAKFVKASTSVLTETEKISAWHTSMMSAEEISEFTNTQLRSFICSARKAVDTSGVKVDSDVCLVIASKNIDNEELPDINKGNKTSLRKKHLQSRVSAYPRILASVLKISGSSFVVDDLLSAMEIANLLISQQKAKVVLVGCAQAFFVVEQLQLAKERMAKIYCSLPIVKNTLNKKTSRVFISSVGVVSSLGEGLENNLQALHSGKVGVANIEKFECDNWAGCVKTSDEAKLEISSDVAYSLTSAQEAIANLADSDIAKIGLIYCSEDCENMPIVANKLGVCKCVKNLKSGLNSGLQGVEYAKMLLDNSDTEKILVLGCDKLEKSQMKLYSALGYLRSDDTEKDFKMSYYSAYRTVFGEGATAFLLEKSDDSCDSNNNSLGEILSCISTLDGENYADANLDNNGLHKAFQRAIEQAGISMSDVDLISWSPRGTAQDSKIINLRDKFFGKIPMISSVFHTGYMENTSALMSLGCLLESLKQSKGLWQQRFGIVYFDDVRLEHTPNIVVALATSHTGGNYVIVVKINKKNI